MPVRLLLQINGGFSSSMEAWILYLISLFWYKNQMEMERGFIQNSKNNNYGWSGCSFLSVPFP